jgi:hypothetical protein
MGALQGHRKLEVKKTNQSRRTMGPYCTTGARLGGACYRPVQPRRRRALGVDSTLKAVDEDPDEAGALDHQARARAKCEETCLFPCKKKRFSQKINPRKKRPNKHKARQETKEGRGI